MKPARQRLARGFRVRFAALLLLAGAFAMAVSTAGAASDAQWTFDDDGGSHYLLISVSSPELFPGDVSGGVNNAALRLVPGRRYGVTVLHPTLHPLQIVAKGRTAAGDAVLLAQGMTVGGLEDDAGIGWTDSGGVVEFTVTPAMAAALVQGGRTPGYRCETHADVMRGDFEIVGGAMEIPNPIPEPLPPGAIAVRLQPVAEGMVSPLGVIQPNDGSGRIFLYDQAGRVDVLLDGIRLATPFLDVSSRLVSLNANFDERGLLGFALHPHFADNGKAYTYTSEPVSGLADFRLPPGVLANHHSVVAEWAVDPRNPAILDPGSRREIMRIDQPQANHNGGQLAFGPDGFLYISLGDGGAADDQGDGHSPEGNGQDPRNVLGSILRIGVDGRTSANGRYGVPADNPFVNDPAGLDEIYAFGFRNPYRFSFDPVTGKLWAGDVGQNDIEEVDEVTAGGNYGWRVKEGSFFFDPNGANAGFVTTVPVVPPPPGAIDPVAEYDHDEGTAIVGGFVYHGAAIPDLQGRYVFGDFAGPAAPSGRLFFLDDRDRPVEFGLSAPVGIRIKGFGQDLSGEIYVCGSTAVGPSGTDGKVLKIVPGDARAR